MNNSDPVPIILHGAGKHDLTDIKEIQVTESFLGLDEGTKRCQTGQSHTDCLTELYRETLRATCGCAPANSLSFYPPKVIAFHLGMLIKKKVFIMLLMLLQTPVCSPEDLVCVSGVNVDNEGRVNFPSF